MNRLRWGARLCALAGSVVTAAMLCSPAVADGDSDGVTTTRLEIVPGPVETRSTPFLAWYQDLSQVGYVEEEYLVSGKANIYEYIDNVAQRPEVGVATPDVPYVTRILVRRPIHPAHFNGTVFVDVLNATAGWDGDAIWYGTYEYIVRSGGAWVGVSTKPVTVNFLRDRWGRAPWPTRNADRYASLSMPAFGQVWDMMTQVGELVKSGGNPHNPFQGFDVERLIMVGYSQSASYQVTYANSFHERSRMSNGRPVYDGYYISAGGARAKDVTGASAATENLPAGDLRNLIQVDAPVIRFQTQTEVVNFPSYTVRQSEPQYPWLRTYETAGGSHVDVWRDVEGGKALTRDLGLPASFCPAPANPINPLRTGYYESAAMENLIRWLSSGVEPPPSRFMELTTTSTGAVALARDADGNVIGGVRPPDLRTPVGTYLESNSGPGFCGLYGGFSAFSEARLKQLYPQHGAYVSRFVQGVGDAVRERYLLQADAAQLRQEMLRQ
jgi:hypothetical protein